MLPMIGQALEDYEEGKQIDKPKASGKLSVLKLKEIAESEL
jgi:hypothetical protein